MNNDLGEKIFSVCILFYESFSSEFIQNFTDINNKEECIKIVSPKVICISSRQGFIKPFREILKQLYRLQISNMMIPLERIICNFMDEIPIPDLGNTKIEYEIGEKIIEFYKPIYEYSPYSDIENFEYLFTSLSCESIFNIFIYLLLEKKIIFFSRRRELLTHACLSFISLLFPFKWDYVLIPVLLLVFAY